jgi:hypothetical protein
LKIPKEKSEEEFEDTKGDLWYLQTPLLITPLVSSNSSSDYSFGIFKLLL